MRHRTQTKLYSRWLKLVKKTNPKTGRFHYSVILDPRIYFNHGLTVSTVYTEYINAWHQHFDPAGCRGSRHSHSWKFRNKTEAEQLVTMALLKWGEHYVA